jgi:hypothetical protein
VPGSADGTPPRWNVYPMRERGTIQHADENGVVTEEPGPVRDARLPFAAVPPLLAARESTPTPATPSPAGSATTKPATTPTSQGSATAEAT